MSQEKRIDINEYQKTYIIFDHEGETLRLGSEEGERIIPFDLLGGYEFSYDGQSSVEGKESLESVALKLFKKDSSTPSETIDFFSAQTSTSINDESVKKVLSKAETISKALDQILRSKVSKSSDEMDKNSVFEESDSLEEETSVETESPEKSVDEALTEEREVPEGEEVVSDDSETVDDVESTQTQEELEASKDSEEKVKAAQADDGSESVEEEPVKREENSKDEGGIEKSSTPNRVPPGSSDAVNVKSPKKKEGKGKKIIIACVIIIIIIALISSLMGKNSNSNVNSDNGGEIATENSVSELVNEDLEKIKADYDLPIAKNEEIPVEVATVLAESLSEILEGQASVKADAADRSLYFIPIGDLEELVEKRITDYDDPGFQEDWAQLVKDLRQISKSIGEEYVEDFDVLLLNPEKQENFIVLIADGTVYYDVLDDILESEN